MKVVLRPINKNTFSGWNRYPNCAYVVGPYLTRSGKRYTGLSELDEEELSKALGVDLKPNSEFWDNFGIRVTDKDVIIDTEVGPEEKLKYLHLKNHRRVSTGARIKAGADFQLIEEESEAKEANVRNRTKRKAIQEFDKLTLGEMRKALRLFGFNAENVANEIVEDMLYKIVEERPQEFLKIWVDNKDKDIYFLIEEAAANNIIRKSKTIYKYGTDIIGHTLEDAVDYLKNPKNQDLKIAILSQIDGKKAVYGKASVDKEIKKSLRTEEVNKDDEEIKIGKVK
jgi:aminopeptidase C